MTPKSLLRHKLCVAKLSDMGPGTNFHRVLHEDAPLCEDREVKRVVICSGKVYYDLFEEREKRGIKDISLLRMEQLYPFPSKALSAELVARPQAEVVWCQEEPKNMGAWTFVQPEIERVLGEIKHKQSRLPYAGRPAAASPATGLLRRHNREQAQLLDEALTLSKH
jgi:2-oxoglutarate dehydrogenase E1 component